MLCALGLAAAYFGLAELAGSLFLFSLCASIILLVRMIPTKD